MPVSLMPALLLRSCDQPPHDLAGLFSAVEQARQGEPEQLELRHQLVQKVLSALAANSRSSMRSSKEALRGSPFLHNGLGSRQLRAGSVSSLFRL